MKKVLKAAGLAIAMFSASASLEVNAQCHLKLDPAQWEEIVIDDFNGTTLNPQWLRGFGESDIFHGKGNEWYPCEFYDDNFHLIEVSGGTLKLRAERLNGSPRPLNSTPQPNPLVDAFSYPYGSGTRNVLYRSGMIKTEVGNFISQINGVPMPYGAYEFKVKLAPQAGNWSTLWLWSCSTEIDIQDSGHPSNSISHNVFSSYGNNHTGAGCADHTQQCLQNYVPWVNNTNTSDGTGMLTSNFCTITMVWTPEIVSFFINGRETGSVPRSSVETVADWPNLMACMQMDDNATSSVAEMEIDYIKLFRPRIRNSVSDYANTPFSTTVDYINHDVTAGLDASPAPNYVGVNGAAGSIAACTKPGRNEVYYRGTGTSSNMYFAKVVNGEWQVTKLTAPSTSCLVVGEVTYNAFHDFVVYRGYDGKLQVWKLNPSTLVWSHGWIDKTPVGDNSCAVRNTPGSIVNADDGTVYYIGNESSSGAGDFKLHRIRYESGTNTWTHLLIPYTYGTTSAGDYLKGDVAWDPLSKFVFYKGQDNRLQKFSYFSSTDTYTHEWVDSNFGNAGNLVSTKPYAICVGDNRVYYVAQDEKIHLAQWSVANGWTISIPANSSYYYPSNGALVTEHFAKGGIAWSEQTNRALYFGKDQRMQYIEYDAGTNLGVHGHIDDYWNTKAFNSFPITSASYPSLSVGANDWFFYNGTNGVNGVNAPGGQVYNRLRYFAMEPCHNIRTQGDCAGGVIYGSVHRNAPLKPSVKLNNSFLDTELLVAPNPTQDRLTVEIPQGVHGERLPFRIYSNVGKTVLSGDLNVAQPELDLSRLEGGIYKLVVDADGHLLKATVVKE